MSVTDIIDRLEDENEKLKAKLAQATAEVERLSWLLQRALNNLNRALPSTATPQEGTSEE